MFPFKPLADLEQHYQLLPAFLQQERFRPSSRIAAPTQVAAEHNESRGFQGTCDESVHPLAHTRWSVVWPARRTKPLQQQSGAQKQWGDPRTAVAIAEPTLADGPDNCVLKVVDAQRPTHLRVAVNEARVLAHLEAVHARLHAKHKRRHKLDSGADIPPGPAATAINGKLGNAITEGDRLLARQGMTAQEEAKSPGVMGPRRFFMRCLDAFTLPAWPHGVQPHSATSTNTVAALSSPSSDGITQSEAETYGSLHNSRKLQPPVRSTPNHMHTADALCTRHPVNAVPDAVPEDAACACLVLERAGPSLEQLLAAHHQVVAGTGTEAGRSCDGHSNRHLSRHSWNGASRGLPLGMVKRVAHDMLQALDFLHRHALLAHADIKPANIVTRSSAQQKQAISHMHASRDDSVPQQDWCLIDFGTSCALPGNCNHGLVPCTLPPNHSKGRASSHAPLVRYDTPAYSPPETTLGLPHSNAGDMWSLGCVLYELATGDRLLHVLPADRYSQLQMDVGEHGLALTTALLGKPPARLLAAAPYSRRYYDGRGSLELEDEYTITPCPLEQRLAQTHPRFHQHGKANTRRTVTLGRAAGSSPMPAEADGALAEDWGGFASFLSPLLVWEPWLRPSARVMLQHAWLQGDGAVQR